MLSVKDIAPEALDEFVAKEHPELNFLQTASWGKVHEVDGFKVRYLGLFDGEKQIGSAMVVIKNAKRGRFMEIPAGPVLDWDGKIQPVRFFIDELKRIANEEKCVFVRIRPNIDGNEKHQKLFEKLGLKLAPFHLHADNTVMLDLTKTEDELMADMRRQTRYEVRRAAKLGVTVDYTTDKKSFNDFYDLQLKTAERQGFVPSPRSLILAQHEVYGDKARIYTAKLGDQILAKGLILMTAPEAIYHEAASTPEGRKLPGAYALTWKVMQDAKRLGIKRYNLFGIAPPNSPHHRFAGVTTFKTGFGGEQIAYLPAHDIVVKPMHYKLVATIEKARKKKRHL